MQHDFSKKYIEVSGEFRQTNGSKQSVERLYDLLYELEGAALTQEDTMTLSNVYSMLGFHKSAYEIYKSVADESDRKVVSKLYAMAEKAKSHENNFILKDIRNLRKQQKIVPLKESDFLISEVDLNKAKIATSVVIFNRIVASNNIEIFNYAEYGFATYIRRVIDFIFWLGGCKDELIEFYNEGLNQSSEETANDDWYYTLDVFRVRINVGKNENLYAEISAGDDFIRDHILDIELDNRTVMSMNYDG